MTEAQKLLVRKTWDMVIPISDKAAELFYGRLFEIRPEVKPLFTNDMAAQGVKLIKTITLAVNGLNNLEILVPVLQELGQKHVGYGVEADHYKAVGEALLWTLGKGLGAEFTKDVEDAWAAVYQVMANTMIMAAEKITVS